MASDFLISNYQLFCPNATQVVLRIGLEVFEHGTHEIHCQGSNDCRYGVPFVDQDDEILRTHLRISGISPLGFFGRFPEIFG